MVISGNRSRNQSRKTRYGRNGWYSMCVIASQSIGGSVGFRRVISYVRSRVAARYGSFRLTSNAVSSGSKVRSVDYFRTVKRAQGPGWFYRDVSCGRVVNWHKFGCLPSGGRPVRTNTGDRS